MNEYRSPEETAAAEADCARIEDILDHAHDNLVSLEAAMRLGEPPAVVEQWINRVWDELRDELDGEDRLRAILILLGDEAHDDAVRLLDADADLDAPAGGVG